MALHNSFKDAKVSFIQDLRELVTVECRIHQTDVLHVGEYPPATVVTAGYNWPFAPYDSGKLSKPRSQLQFWPPTLPRWKGF